MLNITIYMLTIGILFSCNAVATNESVKVSARHILVHGVPYDGVANVEYWGIVDIDRNRKAAFYVVKDTYSVLPDKK